jgi:hypothetical protein
MVFSAPKAINHIKASKKRYAIVEGQKQCLLQAMSFAVNYHTVDVTESDGELFVTGSHAVKRVDKYILK